jgi:hypothetical protein
MKLWTLYAEVFTAPDESGRAAVMAETRQEAMDKARAKLLVVLNYNVGGVDLQHHRVAQAMLNNLNDMSEEPDGVVLFIDW